MLLFVFVCVCLFVFSFFVFEGKVLEPRTDRLLVKLNSGKEEEKSRKFFREKSCPIKNVPYVINTLKKLSKRLLFVSFGTEVLLLARGKCLL